MTSPAVSVVIPCYNLGHYLDEAVDSVLAQTRDDWEIVIVNDGSTDAATNRLLAKYSKPRTTVLSTANRGPGAARNAGIAASTGAYICALDADDRLDPRYFEKAAAILGADERITFVSCWVQLFGDESWVWKQERCDLTALLGECTVATPALVRRSAVLEAGGFDEDPGQWGNEDWLLWIRLVELGHVGVIIPEVLFYYRRRTHSLSEFWGRGAAHIDKMRLVAQKHDTSYRQHLLDVLMQKETRICDLLRANDAAERNLLDLERRVIDRRRDVEVLRGKLPADKRLVTQTDNRLQENAARISERIASQDARIAALERELQSAEARVPDLYASASWRVTAPLRAIYRLLLRRSA